VRKVEDEIEVIEGMIKGVIERRDYYKQYNDMSLILR
jgi:hypothetical protein